MSKPGPSAQGAPDAAAQPPPCRWRRRFGPRRCSAGRSLRRWTRPCNGNSPGWNRENRAQFDAGKAGRPKNMSWNYGMMIGIISIKMTKKDWALGKIYGKPGLRPVIRYNEYIYTYIYMCHRAGWAYWLWRFLHVLGAVSQSFPIECWENPIENPVEEM